MSLKCFLIDHSDPHFRSLNQRPGAMWYAPWYFDPAKDDRSKIINDEFFSVFYRQEYSLRRPPLVVRCPNGGSWIVDQKANNGDGWRITGDAPNITCTPSINMGQYADQSRGYHGFLQNGEFTADLEGRTYA